jgi:hypothetical protein
MITFRFPLTLAFATGFLASTSAVFSQAPGFAADPIQKLVVNGNIVVISATDFQYDGSQVFVLNGGELHVDGAHHFHSLSVRSNGLVTHPGDTGSGLNLTLDSDVLLAGGGSISATGKGFGENAGPGAGVDGGTYGGGGSYGGNGGRGEESSARAGDTYGSPFLPQAFGSGGGSANGGSWGSGRPGGGAIRLDIGGDLFVGPTSSISANGLNPGASSYSGAGSGGSIWITVGKFDGQGVIEAIGGDAVYGGAGGGGRIALYVDDDLFIGTTSATGGVGANNGGAGSIFKQVLSSNHSELKYDNGGTSGGQTEINAVLNAPGDMVVTGSAELTSPREVWLDIDVVGDFSISSDSSVNVDGKGYGGNVGPGAGIDSGTYGGGGGYGGSGGQGAEGTALGGITYGDCLDPLDFGSGGGSANGGSWGSGRPGGGVVNLSVLGALNLETGCSISSDGASGASNSYGGAGSGGTVRIFAEQIIGDGQIRANGGSTGHGGGGGGGRITLFLNAAAYGGDIQAFGGLGENPGGAGSVLQSVVSIGFTELRFNNGGILDGQSPLPSPLVLNGSMVVEGGSELTGLKETQLEISVTEDLTLLSGGRISVDGQGYGKESGPGAGADSGSYGGGGGHGGAGGNGSGTGANGGGSYGSVSQPIDFGSGGGSANGGSWGVGRTGGGAAKLDIGGELFVDLGCSVSADGRGAGNSYAGGGAGGSLWITANGVSGGGIISANGGNGSVYGGAGGGGRIAFYTINGVSNVTVEVAGGAGFEDGAPGTIHP